MHSNKIKVLYINEFKCDEKLCLHLLRHLIAKKKHFVLANF